MPLTERERYTKERYDVTSEEWLERSGGRNRVSFWPEGLSGLRSELDINAKILEVGCGPATDGRYLSGIGFSVVSTDYTKPMLNLAKELYPKGFYSVTEMQELSFAKDSFDGFWATACLLHLENPVNALKELSRVTRDSGAGFISIKEGWGETIDPKTGYYFKYYTPKQFHRILSNNRFEILKEGRKAGSQNHDWLTYLVRVRK